MHNLSPDTFRPDIRFGFPSSEPGTGFSDVTKCRYFEALEYQTREGTRVHHESGEVDDKSFRSWVEKVQSLEFAPENMLILLG